MKTDKDMMHGYDYAGQDIYGWMASEKLNGCRAFWDGRTMWTRGGKVIRIPETMRRMLPAEALDGEIHAGRYGFETARQAVQYGRFTPACQFSAFDVPDHPSPFHVRYQYLRTLLPAFGPVNYLRHIPGIALDEAVSLMLRIQAQGGEGVMLNDPEGFYQPSRTARLLKLTISPLRKEAA